MSERNKTQGRQTSRIYSPCILADHHPVSWLLSPPRRSVPIAVLPLGLVQAAASHAATHEQVNHASRGHKPRAIRGGDAAHENGRRARRGRRTVGEASSAHGRPLCVIGAYQRAERIFAEVGHEADRFSALWQLEDWQSQVATASSFFTPFEGGVPRCLSRGSTGMPIYSTKRRFPAGRGGGAQPEQGQPCPNRPPAKKRQAHPGRAGLEASNEPL